MYHSVTACLCLLCGRFGRPDQMMERPYDISANIKLSAVRYLHTMRFLKEIIAFCQHFPQLIDAFQRMKASAEGNLVNMYTSKLTDS